MTRREDETEDSLDSIASYLKDEFELDGKDIEEMLDEYFKNLDSLLSAAMDNMASGDFAAMKKTGHTIKGVAANVGSSSISAIGSEIEVEAAAADAEACRTLVESIKRQYEAMKASRDEKG